jgi:hypothetical protein
MGPGGYWLMMALGLFLTSLYGLWRMTRRPSAYAEEDNYEAVSYANLLPGAASSVAVETAHELYVEAAEEMAEASEEGGTTAATGTGG